MIVAFNYHPPRHYGPRIKSILGMPIKRTGLLQYEFWGRRGRTRAIIGIEALVLREGVRRKMDLGSNSVDFMIGGFINKRTGEDVWPQGKPETEEECDDPGVQIGTDVKVDEVEDEGHNDDGDSGWETKSDASVDVGTEPGDMLGDEGEQDNPKWWDSTSDDQTDVTDS